MTERSYILELKCPRCGAESQITVTRADWAANVNCGECLMRHVELVPLTLVNATVHPTLRLVK